MNTEEPNGVDQTTLMILSVVVIALLVIGLVFFIAGSTGGPGSATPTP